MNSLHLPYVASHVSLMVPPSRFQNPSGVAGAQASIFPTLLEASGGCHNFACLWFNQGCQPGCSKCTDRAGMAVMVSAEGVWNDTCSEVNGTQAPTVKDARLRTYRDTSEHGDWTWRHPWRSPGFAPVFSPCGLAGGGATPGDWLSESLQEHIVAGAVTPPFIRRGFDARDVPDSPKAIWARGSVQEVAWSIFLNKGGGYAYRLCPRSEGRLTEECFERHHLEYASAISWIQRGKNRASRTPINASRISEGTHPHGSTWTKNPIPPCAHADGSPVHEPPACPSTMFKPALPDLYGDGPGSCVQWAIHGPVEGYHTLYDSFGNAVYKAPCTKEEGLALAKRFQFSIFDEVVVPPSLTPGEYTLSFRLDAELTPQVWAQCSDIKIT